MWILDLLCKVVGLAASFLTVLDKICTYCRRKGKDPSGFSANDGSESESSDS